jgi:hypothetical protein
MHLGTENKEEEYIMVNQVNGNEDKLMKRKTLYSMD